jgi:hypothetical protein
MYGYLSQPSKVNSHLIDTFIQMASSTGEDGKGKGSLTGYFKRLARRDPMEMAQLLGKALRWPTAKPDSGHTPLTHAQLVRLTLAEHVEFWQKMNLQSAERAMEQNPIPRAIMEGAALVGENGIGKNGLPGYLKQLQRRHPRAMTKALGKVLAYPAEPSAGREVKEPTEEEVAAYLRWLEEDQAALQRAQEEYDAELRAKRADGDSPDP